MNITIARIRSNVTYTGPLETVLDSFFENYVKWRDNNPQHKYDTYNVSFGNGRPKRTPETIKWADVIVIPLDGKFSPPLYNTFKFKSIIVFCFCQGTCLTQ